MTACTWALWYAWIDLNKIPIYHNIICNNISCAQCYENAKPAETLDLWQIRNLYVIDPIELMRLSADVTECNKQEDA